MSSLRQQCASTSCDTSGSACNQEHVQPDDENHYDDTAFGGTWHTLNRSLRSMLLFIGSTHRHGPKWPETPVLLRRRNGLHQSWQDRPQSFSHLSRLHGLWRACYG